MHASILTLTGVLAALGAAAPAATSQAFEITDLKTCEVDAGNTTIEFTVHDPDPLTDAYAKCTGVWKTGSGGYPSGSYERCGNSTFAWNMAAHKSFFDFTLGIEHTFEDPAVGDYPYNMVTNFGKANVSNALMTCSSSGSEGSCVQKVNSTIKAPIWATAA